MKCHKIEQMDAIDLRIIINFVLSTSHDAYPILSHDDTTLAILLESLFGFINSHTGLSTFNAAQPLWRNLWSI